MKSMPNRLRRLALTLALAAAVAGTAPGAAAGATDPFYADLLREGSHAYDRGDFPAAARHLRLACFGLLEEPQPLADCLVRLALAQDRAGDAQGFRDTFRRVVEIEERFGAYAKAPAELRAAYEQRLAVLIPAATLETVPAFRGVAARTARDASPDKKRRGEARGGDKTATVPPPAAQPTTAVKPPVAEPKPEPAAPAATAPRPLSGAERSRMADARRLLAEEGKVRELKQAFQIAREVADAHPESPEAQHLAAEAAYRISRWQDAAAYFRRGGEPAEAEPELQFYMAVALYESGDAAGAATLLRRSLPNLQRSAYIDDYARKILGSEAGARIGTQTEGSSK